MFSACRRYCPFHFYCDTVEQLTCCDNLTRNKYMVKRKSACCNMMIEYDHRMRFQKMAISRYVNNLTEQHIRTRINNNSCIACRVKILNNSVPSLEISQIFRDINRTIHDNFLALLRKELFECKRTAKTVAIRIFSLNDNDSFCSFEMRYRVV